MSSRRARQPRIFNDSYDSYDSNGSLEFDTSALDASDADDEKESVMSLDYVPSRPLTVAIPRSTASGPYCPRRPNLAEILANTAPPPWTLSAFMAYLSQNHCLETLEFTMDASRYRKHYSKMVNRNPGQPVMPNTEECQYVTMLWQRLLDAYIAPNGAREVNLPANIRDPLLHLSEPYIPPHPSALDPAVAKVKELMEESVLVPFLSSVCSSTAHPDTEAYDPLSHAYTRSYDERALHSASTHGSPNYYRASAPSSLSSTFQMTRNYLTHGHGHSARSSASPSAPDNLGLTSDTDSGSVAGSDPMTPPTTPPGSDFGGSPRDRTSGASHSAPWKRVSSKLGWGGSKAKKERNSRYEEDVSGPDTMDVSY